jgi:MYXO-CTERM domain-containing protein
MARADLTPPKGVAAMSTLARRGLLAACLLVLGSLLALAARPVAAQPPLDEMLSVCGQAPSNPYLVTTCFVQGRPAARDAAVVAFRDTPDDSGHIALASANQVGAVYGLGYHAGLETLYTAAFHKRGVPFGPAGPGGVYAINLRSGAVATFLTVPNAGTDTHTRTNNYFPDTRARFPTGTTSLGDLDLSEDGSELAVMNLNDRKIYRFAVPAGTPLGSFSHGAAGQPWAADARPFGLAYHDGRLYHGVVRSAQSSQNPDELWAFVYRSAPDGSEMQEVSSTSLRYDRGELWPGEGEAIWNPWKDPPGTLVPNRGRFPMPMLADIAFAPGDSQMIVGFRDRFGDMTFYTTPPNQPPPGEEIYNTPGGDIVPAWPADDLWRFQVSPEYYTGDFGPNPRNTHDETSFGGLAVLPDGDTVAMTANSPIVISSAGAVWLSISAGSDKGREEIYRFGSGGDNFGKANGLGDLEVICAPQQQTPTPTVTETSTATATVATPTATVTLTPSATVATPTATVVLTATPTDTGVPTPSATVPSPTVTRTPVISPTPSNTPRPTATVPTVTPGGPTVTPRSEEESPPEEAPTPAPGATPMLPTKLPQTGEPPDDGGAPLVAVLLALAVLWALARRRAT